MEGPSFDHPEAIAAAMGVLDRHLAALNSGDAVALSVWGRTGLNRCLRAQNTTCYLGHWQVNDQGQPICTTQSPTAASTEVVIAEIFESHLTDLIPGRPSWCALVAAAYVQNTGRPGPRIQMAGFICGSPMKLG